MAGGGEAVLVHPPTRTNAIPQSIRIRMGSLIQEKYEFDLINVPQRKRILKIPGVYAGLFERCIIHRFTA
jgi:hypothetical protein